MTCVISRTVPGPNVPLTARTATETGGALGNFPRRRGSSRTSPRAKRALVDHGARGDLQARRSVQFLERQIRIRYEPAGGELREQLCFREKALRLTRELREDERLGGERPLIGRLDR